MINETGQAESESYKYKQIHDILKCFSHMSMTILELTFLLMNKPYDEQVRKYMHNIVLACLPKFDFVNGQRILYQNHFWKETQIGLQVKCVIVADLNQN
jgi:hypothetical protein